MAHYDCDNCGYRMGIAYGTCGNCTPYYVIDAERNYNKARFDAKQKISREFQELENELERVKNQRIESLVAEERAAFERLYENGKSWYWESMAND